MREAFEAALAKAIKGTKVALPKSVRAVDLAAMLMAASDGVKPTCSGRDDYLDKMNLFTTAGARSRHARGRTARWWDLVFRPPFSFFRAYVLQAGFLDGRAGFVLAVLGAKSVFLKYTKLAEMNRAAEPAS